MSCSFTTRWFGSFHGVFHVPTFQEVFITSWGDAPSPAALGPIEILPREFSYPCIVFMKPVSLSKI
jgi:hypothetical protein